MCICKILPQIPQSQDQKKNANGGRFYLTITIAHLLYVELFELVPVLKTPLYKPRLGF